MGSQTPSSSSDSFPPEVSMTLSEPANPDPSVKRSNAPLKSGNIFPASGSVTSEKKSQSMSQMSPHSSFPKMERSSQTPPSSSDPFPPVVSKTRADVPKTLDPSFTDMPMRSSMGAQPQRGGRGGMVTLNFDDADVYSVIQTIFGTVLKVNYVVDPRVKGRVTFRAVTPVPVESVLPLMAVILRLNGIGVVEESGLYRLVPIGDVSKAKPQVFVYLVQNGKAKDIASILQQTFLGGKAASGGVVSSTQGSSAQSAQSPTGTQASPSQIATGSQTLVSDFTKFIPDEVTNSIVILSTPDEYVLIKGMLSQIDSIPRQVIIEGLIAQVTLTDNLSIGLSAWIKGNIGNFSVSGGIGGSNLATASHDPSGTGLTLYGIDGVGDLQFMIASLAADSRAKLLATPHILVSDNKEAKIQIGQQVPLVTSETYGSTTLVPQRTIQYRDIGIILKVKPRVNDGGLVNLELYQEVSTYETIALYDNEKQIILNKNDATTSVVVQDGQTIVIGGLIREDTTKSKSGIPFLSRIPYLGWIFGTWLDNKQRTEIVILLTPRVVKNQKQAGEVTDRYIDTMVTESKGRIQKKDLVREKQQVVDDKGLKVPDAVKEFLRLD